MSIFEPAKPPWPERMLAIFRVIAGLVFMTAGTTIVFGYPPGPVGMPPFSLTSQMGIGGILELVGGPNFALDIDALASKGRLLVVGSGGGEKAEFSLRAFTSRRGRILGTVLRARPLEEKAVAVQAFGHHLLSGLADGRLRGIVDRVFPVEDVDAAFDYMAQPGKFGKVLLEF